MDTFVKQVINLLDEYDKYQETGFDALSKALTLFPSVSDPQDANVIIELGVTARRTVDTLSGTIDGMKSLAETIRSIPRFTTKLNKSKKQTAATIESMMARFQRSSNLVDQIATAAEQVATVVRSP